MGKCYIYSLTQEPTGLIMKNDRDEIPQNTAALNNQIDTFEQLLQRRLSRRQLIKGSLGLAIGSLFAESAFAEEASQLASQKTASLFDTLKFKSIPASMLKDTVEVPQGYTAKVLYPWGEPIKAGVAGFKQDASNTAAEQALQAGMHHDGMHFFPIDNNPNHGLLVMNHEYIDATLLHTDGGFKDNPDTYSKEKVDKEMAAHGVSIIEIQKQGDQWTINKNSKYARRITTATPMQFTGVAGANDLLKTNADPSGMKPVGTNNNCANGFTPWGTYLTCEENFQIIFGGLDDDLEIDDSLRTLHKRYGIRDKSFYGWEKHHKRFSVKNEPNEPNRFGWIIEIDPFDPNSTPKKHTAMGRFRHENCANMIGEKKAGHDDKIAFYSGDDSRFEYIYKFIPSKNYNPNDQQANRDLLESGILYVAKFNDDGSGQWLALIHGEKGLTAENGFANQAEIMIKTRLAAKIVGATPMDRPEWIAVNQQNKRMYCTLTNNSKREETSAVSPRKHNEHGHIISWKEEDNNPHALNFSWDVFLLAGDPSSQQQNLKGNIIGDIFSSPDGLFIDPRGALWIQTDISGSTQNTGEYENFGNNQMLVADPVTKEVRRFLTGPVGAEITGTTMTADMKSLFVNIQHPGDVPGGLKDTVKKTPENPKAASSWPDGEAGGRPRSATIVVSKDDGGLIGT